MTKHRPITISLNTDMLRLIDSQRGDVSRSRFVERLIENAIERRKAAGAHTQAASGPAYAHTQEDPRDP